MEFAVVSPVENILFKVGDNDNTDEDNAEDDNEDEDEDEDNADEDNEDEDEDGDGKDDDIGFGSSFSPPKKLRVILPPESIIYT
jgi:hypothetical protein